MKWVYDDGGRADAGIKGNARDCAARSISIATRMPYLDVRNGLTALGSAHERPRKGGHRSNGETGVFTRTVRRFFEDIGWSWVPTMGIGTGCTVHLRDGELPMGRLVVSVSRHFTAVVDGVIHDNHDPSREGSRCVYGYWLKGD